MKLGNPGDEGRRSRGRPSALGAKIVGCKGLTNRSKIGFLEPPYVSVALESLIYAEYVVEVGRAGEKY